MPTPFEHCWRKELRADETKMETEALVPPTENICINVRTCYMSNTFGGNTVGTLGKHLHHPKPEQNSSGDWNSWDAFIEYIFLVTLLFVLCLWLSIRGRGSYDVLRWYNYGISLCLMILYVSVSPIIPFYFVSPRSFCIAQAITLATFWTSIYLILGTLIYHFTGLTDKTTCQRHGRSPKRLRLLRWAMYSLFLLMLVEWFFWYGWYLAKVRLTSTNDGFVPAMLGVRPHLQEVWHCYCTLYVLNMTVTGYLLKGVRRKKSWRVRLPTTPPHELFESYRPDFDELRELFMPRDAQGALNRVAMSLVVLAWLHTLYVTPLPVLGRIRASQRLQIFENFSIFSIFWYTAKLGKLMVEADSDVPLRQARDW